MPYRVHWAGSNRHYPNLVAYPKDGITEPLEPVGVTFGEVPKGELVNYTSLAHLWSGKRPLLRV